ncbi:MAG: response regulator [Nitrososphaerota archaeon]|nr:response regulator [Nitrososphaerota archaeon]
MKKLRALIVEDSTDDALLLQNELERSGYQLESLRVETDSSMQEAISDHEWDIVFSDWSLPQFSALAALEIIKRSELDIPFIIVSGSAGEDTVIGALRSGAHDFFVKGKLTLLSHAIERELHETMVRREHLQMREQLVLADRLVSVGILAAGVGHEINNPLASLIGNLDLALGEMSKVKSRSQVPDDLKALHEEIRDARDAAQRIRNVANDLKLFARADVEEIAAVDIQSIVESSLRLAGNEIRNRAKLRMNFEKLPPVSGNESRLGQVFLNLIINAAQSIPEGNSIENEISLSGELDPSGNVVVEIRDSGSGMTDEIKKQLFTPFFTTKPIGVGTGLGLSICRRIVDSMGGTISVESEVGTGSSFRVKLPSISDDSIDRGDSAVPTTTSVYRGSVLVIDDEPSIGAIISRILSEDCEVTNMVSAQEALEVIKHGRKFDVILCDLMMPHFSGMEFHTELSKLAPGQESAVIFLTGGAFTKQARKFLHECSNLCIEKPFDIAELRQIVSDRFQDRSLVFQRRQNYSQLEG